MITIRQQYYKKANNMINRLLDEADEPNEPATDTPTTATDDTNPNPDEGTPEADETEENGQAQQIDIYFSNLNDETQKVLMDALKENLNVSETDDFAEQKITKILSEKPLITLRAEELIRELNIEI